MLPVVAGPLWGWEGAFDALGCAAGEAGGRAPSGSLWGGQGRQRRL